MLSPEKEREIWVESITKVLIFLLCYLGFASCMAISIAVGEEHKWEHLRTECIQTYTTEKCDEYVGKTYDKRSPFYLDYEERINEVWADEHTVVDMFTNE